MFKTIMTAIITLYLFASASLYAGSDYYGKIGVGYLDDKMVGGNDSKGNRIYSYGSGAGILFGVGYNTDIVGFEAEYTYGSVDNENLELVDENTSQSINGYQDTHSAMFNILYRPVMDEKFNPYVGVGFGLSYVVWESANIGVSDGTLTFTSQLMIGASYDILDNLALNIELKHKALPGYDVAGVGSVKRDTHNEFFLSLVYRIKP